MSLCYFRKKNFLFQFIIDEKIVNKIYKKQKRVNKIIKKLKRVNKINKKLKKK